MEIVLKVEGMMCAHCEARVKKVVEQINGVIEAIPSHVESKVVVKLSKNVAEKVIKKAIEKEGYKVL